MSYNLTTYCSQCKGTEVIRMKGKERKELNRKRKRKEMELTWGPNSIRDIQLLIMNKLDNTTVIILDSIDRDPELKPRIAPLDRIKQKHCFVYKNNECFAYELSSEVSTSYPIPFMFKYL